MSKILGVSVLEFMEGEHSGQAYAIQEVEKTAIAVLNYSSGEVNRKVQKTKRKYLTFLLSLFAALLALILYLLWFKGYFFIPDRCHSPDGSYTVTVYDKMLDGGRFTAEDGVSLNIDKNGEDLHYLLSYGNCTYQGIWWAPDSQKFLLSLETEYGTRLILESMEPGTSTNLDTVQGRCSARSELDKSGYTMSIGIEQTDYQFLQWSKDSESMLIFYSFQDLFNEPLHEGYFWYNYVTGDVNAILELEKKAR